ncbi:hypothetical protein ECANGB1_539 [Enterospora canceri]|uniref:Uncharacterized protein n=1 Tax=Enterospora canceri TaxID=1081671 RepID=A0A1Y1S915_9MICR|nr:hypothetical protein ECANGB1_539 [Enterospora canceri]
MTLPPIVKDDFIILRDLDGGEIVFLNQSVSNLPTEDDVLDRIREMWESVPVPNYQNVLEELNRAGIKHQTEEAKKEPVKKIEKRKKYKRRIKITNTHVKGLDLNNLSKQED